MRDGFIKVATVTPELRVADVAYNGDIIAGYMTPLNSCEASPLAHIVNR